MATQLATLKSPTALEHRLNLQTFAQQPDLASAREGIDAAVSKNSHWSTVLSDEARADLEGRLKFVREAQEVLARTGRSIRAPPGGDEMEKLEREILYEYKTILAKQLQKTSDEGHSVLNHGASKVSAARANLERLDNEYLALMRANGKLQREVWDAPPGENLQPKLEALKDARDRLIALRGDAEHVGASAAATPAERRAATEADIFRLTKNQVTGAESEVADIDAFLDTVKRAATWKEQITSGNTPHAKVTPGAPAGKNSELQGEVVQVAEIRGDTAIVLGPNGTSSVPLRWLAPATAEDLDLRPGGAATMKVDRDFQEVTIKSIDGAFAHVKLRDSDVRVAVDLLWPPRP